MERLIDLGSSPLTRGGQRDRSEKILSKGLIPAYAGRTATSFNAATATSAHPRLRGADNSNHKPLTALRGSSPLTRGGPEKNINLLHAKGLIPAYAGRTYTPLRNMRKAAAHPRLRGADAGIWIAAGAFCGSSPLTRGGRVTSINHKCVRRLIPAYAGRTLGSVNAAAGCGAHPRLRGADVLTRPSFAALDGSSPLTRGGLIDLFTDPDDVGLIPAYAGRTCADY